MHKRSLIIGINKYKHFAVLKNCINDAYDLHTFLSGIGFESTLLTDPKQADLIEAIKNFKDSILENTISLIFYSGHGLQDEKCNYIVPSDSEIRFSEDIKYNCVLADDLLIKNNKKNLHLVILDACRNNPFYSGNKSFSIGLVKMNAPSGTLIAFSTSPNSTSIERIGDRNGVFTKHLLKNMQTPNLPVELVFKNTRNDVMNDTSQKQIPWEESCLTGDHYSFIEKQEETIDNLFIAHLTENKTILLPELMSYLKASTFESETIETLIFILILVNISISNEEEEVTARTVDQDYFNEILFDQCYPRFEKRLIKEDTSTDLFEIETFNKLKIVKDINFGFNWLETPNETFSQLLINYVKFNNDDGILCFYLFPKDDDHFLKPIIITVDDNRLKLHNYSIITGDKVNDLTDVYFKMRLPFEKEISKFSSSFTVEEMDSDEFER